MDTQQKSISSHATHSALAGMLFFAPFVKRYLSKTDVFSEYEKKFILGYVQIGFANLIFLLIFVCTAIIGSFINSPIIDFISNIIAYAIYSISIFCFFTCIGGLAMWEEGESLMQNVQEKGEILKSYIPVLNFALRFKKTDYSMPYRWLKESVFLRSGFIALSLLFGSYVGIGMLIIIAIRLILLMINIDITPLNMKKNINNSFLCYPGEVVAYLSAFIKNKFKKEDYQKVLQEEKLKYTTGYKFGINITMQYILFIGILVLLYHNIDISLLQIVLAVALLLFILKIFIFYRNKNALPCIPFLAEIVSLIVK